MRVNGKGCLRIVLAVALLSTTILPALRPMNAYAAQITNRSLTLQSGATDGGSKPGGVVNHQFNFTVPSTTDIGSIQFLYCTTASGTCTTPTGLDTTTTTLGSEAGSGATGFSIVTNTVDAPNGAPYLTRTASAPSTQTLSYRLDSVTNPTTPNEAFFVRISTFASSDITGAPTDTGTVAASTANEIILSGTMPESLIFCTGAEVLANGGGIPDCSTATSGAVSFNQLFSPTDTSTATSQMAASTNATNGYSISVNGPTLTSGANTISPMTTAAAGTRGISQFGMNLVANTTTTSTPAVGIAITPSSNATDLKAKPTAGYDTPDTFKYTNGDIVAVSDDGGTSGPTNAQIYTSSYIVNVSGSQTAGTYTTTLTYVCTATF